MDAGPRPLMDTATRLAGLVGTITNSPLPSPKDAVLNVGFDLSLISAEIRDHAAWVGSGWATFVRRQRGGGMSHGPRWMAIDASLVVAALLGKRRPELRVRDVPACQAAWQPSARSSGSASRIRVAADADDPGSTARAVCRSPR
jgi:hypothetical protein